VDEDGGVDDRSAARVLSAVEYEAAESLLGDGPYSLSCSCCLISSMRRSGLSALMVAMGEPFGRAHHVVHGLG
jgi:hypothetical protein